MENQSNTSGQVSRKDALKKIGYGAFTLSTMMFVLDGFAKNNSDDWGNWDDVNEANKMKGGTLSTNNHGSHSSPGQNNPQGSHSSGGQNGPNCSPDPNHTSSQSSGGSSCSCGGGSHSSSCSQGSQSSPGGSGCQCGSGCQSGSGCQGSRSS